VARNIELCTSNMDLDTYITVRNTFSHVGLEVFTAMTMKSTIFWDVTPCRSYENRCFGGTCRLHLQGRENSREGSSISSWLAGQFSSQVNTKMEHAYFQEQEDAATHQVFREKVHTVSANLMLCHCLLMDSSCPDEGGNTFLHNIGSHKVYKGQHLWPRSLIWECHFIWRSKPIVKSVL
jgi:hypothetical protein